MVEIPSDSYNWYMMLPARDNKGHKGTFGSLIIFGGSLADEKVMLGGPALAAKAAIRSGVGLVGFLGDKQLLVSLIELVPQAIGIVSEAELIREADRWQAIVIGPGLGSGKPKIKVIEKLLSLKLPTVIDADGLNALSEYSRLFKSIHDKCVLTPHPKEFERLAKAMDVDDPAVLARRLGCVLVLKGSGTEIFSASRSWKREYDNPVLATGGTGDVLAGLIGGLAAQYYPDSSIFNCAKFGVEIHARAAEEWRRRHGSGGMILDELMSEIPGVMENMRRN